MSAFPNVKIHSTRNGGTPIDGSREDLVVGESIVVSLTNVTGVTSWRWELWGRPEYSTAGGAGPSPWLLGSGASASFSVDPDVGAVHLDGTYTVVCTVNAGSPTETRISACIARDAGLTVPASPSGTRSLRKLGAFESMEDTISIPGTMQGWATQMNRWLELIRITAAGAGVSLTLAGAYTNGAAAPAQTLALTDVDGGGLVIDATSVGYTGANAFSVLGSGGRNMVVTRTGLVGIGTSAPAKTLHLKEASTTTTRYEQTNAPLVIDVVNDGTGLLIKNATAGTTLLSALATTGVRGDLGFGIGAVPPANVALAMGGGFAGAVAVSAANTGRLRYNENIQDFEKSINGAAWATFGGGTVPTSTLNQILYGSGAPGWNSSANLSWNGTGIGIYQAAADAAINIGGNIGVSGLTPSRMITIGISSAGSAGIFFGQDSTHGLLLFHTYNATPGNSQCYISTYGQSLPLTISVSNLTLNAVGAAGVLAVTASRNLFTVNYSATAIGALTWDGFHVVGTLALTGGTPITEIGMGRIGVPGLSGTVPVTIADGAALILDGPMATSGNVTVTRGYTIWSKTGKNRFGGNVLVGTAIDLAASRTHFYTTTGQSDGLTITGNYDTSSGNAVLYRASFSSDSQSVDIGRIQGGFTQSEGTLAYAALQFRAAGGYEWYSTTAASGGLIGMTFTATATTNRLFLPGITYPAGIELYTQDPADGGFYAAQTRLSVGKTIGFSDAYATPMLAMNGDGISTMSRIPGTTFIWAPFYFYGPALTFTNTGQAGIGPMAMAYFECAGAIGKNNGNTYTATSLSTVYIKSEPTSTITGVTITTLYAFFVDHGVSRFDGDGTYVFELPADATGNVTAATGRVPVKVGGATKYFRYYDS